MRILIVLHQFYPEFSGGTERVSLNLAHCAQRAGHYVRILACAVSPNAASNSDGTGGAGLLHSVYEGIPVSLLPRALLPASADFSLEVEKSLVQPLADWMQGERFDVCHVMHTMRMSTAVLAAQHCGLPYILTLTDFFLACPRINQVDLDNQVCDGPEGGNRCGLRCLTAPWSRDSLVSRYQRASQLLAGASLRVAPSAFVAKQYRKTFPYCDFRVVAHGLDLPALKPDQPVARKTGVGASKLTLGYVGAVIPQKGLDVLLRALALVPDRGIALKVIGGFYGAGAYHAEVLALASADSRVEILGHLAGDKVFQAMAQLDLLCLPSRVPETFSLALHEAAALGVPALVSNLGAPSEQVGSTGAGRVLGVDAVEEWAQAIIAVANDPQQIRQWQARLPLPLRVEEEGFYYESLYRTMLPNPG